MFRLRVLGKYAAIALAVLVAACTATPPPAPPPPPPVAIYIPPPPRPAPPLDAIMNFPLPPKDIYGARITPNSNLDDAQRLWHFRSAFNVAALSCTDAGYYRMAEDYNLFLTVNKKPLDDANKAVEAKFKAENGKDYARIRDTFSTQVYNFFSLPPVKTEFCNTLLALGEESTSVLPADLSAFSARAFPQVEGVFEAFFAAYEKYETDLALWIALYAPGEQPVTSFTTTTYPTTPAFGPSYGPAYGPSDAPADGEWVAHGDWSTNPVPPAAPEG